MGGRRPRGNRAGVKRAAEEAWNAWEDDAEGWEDGEDGAADDGEEEGFVEDLDGDNAGPKAPSGPPPQWLLRQAGKEPPAKLMKASAKSVARRSPPGKEDAPAARILAHGQSRWTFENTPAKAPVAKAPAKASVAKAPAAKAPVAKAPVAKVSGAAPERAVSAAPKLTRQGSSEEYYKDYADVDPLYALIGELGHKKVCTADSVDQEALSDFLQRVMRPVVWEGRKPKDWIELWATMNVPVTHQAEVLRPLMQTCLESEVAGEMPMVLAELLKGHRVKIKAVEESAKTIFECGEDTEDGCLLRFFVSIFPKSPTSEWGWSRVGWSWREWWGTAERILDVLEESAAFTLLASLLKSIEEESGVGLKEQAIWDEKRLAAVRAALCRYGSLADEDELATRCEASIL